MTATSIEGQIIDTPGVYEIPDVIYHGDPAPEGSLSVSGAKKLLPPSCPALFKWERDHGRPDTAAFDFGHAAHKLALGVGPAIVEVEADDWRTKAAKEKRELIRLDGGVPLLTAAYAEVHAMAEALKRHPLAMSLFEGGTPEASLFFRDDITGVMRRSRLDWLPASSPSGRMIIPDYKTAVTANPAVFGKNAAAFGYHMQAPWYCDAVTALDLAEDVAFVFVVQEKVAPYLVSVCELDSLALRIGREANRAAIDLYHRCREADEWPGWGDEVALVSLPRWIEYAYEGAQQ